MSAIGVRIGYTIFRHKGLYFRWPFTFGGDESIKEIPSDPVEFETYLASKRKDLEELLQTSTIRKAGEWYHPVFQLTISGTPFERHWRQRTLEIDLDHFIVYINDEPLFDLRCMPDRNNWSHYIGFDKYDRLCFTSNTPEKHRYKLPPAPPIKAEVLEIYKSSQAQSIATHDVLGVPIEMRTIEKTRMKIMQVLIAALMTSMSNREGKGINTVLSMRVPNNVIARLRILCGVFATTSMFSDAISSQFYGEYVYEHLDSWRWIVEGLFCMLVVPRIDDESTLRAAVVDLMGNVSQYYRAKECAVGTVFYGAVFSLYEVSIVRFTVAERSGHDVRFQLKHTPSLRLLPREHASVPQTPGIEALTRLGQIILEKITRHNIITKNAFRHRSARSNSRILSLPVEICMNIARHLSPKTLLGFATISASCADTAADLLVQPYFGPSPSNIQNRSLFLEHSWYRVLSLPRSPGIELDTSGSAIIGTKDQDLHFSTFFAMNEEGQVLTFTVACAPALSHLKISEMPDKEKPKDYHQMAVVFGVGSKWCESPYD